MRMRGLSLRAKNLLLEPGIIDWVLSSLPAMVFILRLYSIRLPVYERYFVRLP